MLKRRTICHNFRNLQEFQSERKRTVFYDLEKMIYHAPQLRGILPEEFKRRNTIILFKNDVRKSICNECPCRIVQSICVFDMQLLTWYLIVIMDLLLNLVLNSYYGLYCMFVYIYIYIYIYMCIYIYICYI